MNILITGIAGFIGFHLAERVVKEGHTVTGIDNLNSYYSPQYKLARLKELGVDTSGGNQTVFKSSRYNNLTFYKGDIADSNLLESIFSNSAPSIICNLAAQAGVRYSFENPLAYVHSNITGFVTLLETAKKFGVTDIVYASSSSVYGNNSTVPFSEKDRVDMPQSLYAATKKSNELIAHVYASQLGFNMTGLRFFTVYGPWGRPDMAPFMFIRKIMKGERIKIFNNGNLSRDFSYISDIVEGICKVLHSMGSSTERGKYALYNIGHGSPVNLMDFVNTLEETAGRKAVKEMVPMQQGDVYTTYASTEQLERDFGFKPSVTLKDGIQRLFNWYMEHNIEIDKWGL